MHYQPPMPGPPAPPPSDGSITAHGHRGRYVRLTRDGWVEVQGGRPGPTVTRLHVSQITAMQLTSATALTHGNLRIAMGGTTARRQRPGKRNRDAARDENAVIFRKSQQAEFDQLVHAIERAQAAFRRL